MAESTEYTPIRAKTGRVTHAVSLHSSTIVAACGKKCSGKGWRIALWPLDCLDCIAIVFRPVKRQTRRRVR